MFYLFEIGLEKIDLRKVILCLIPNPWPKKGVSNNFGGNGNSSWAQLNQNLSDGPSPGNSACNGSS